MYLKRIAGLVHAHQRMLQRLEAGRRGNVARVMTSVNVQQRIVPLLDVLHQLLNLLYHTEPDMPKTVKAASP